MSNKDEKVIKDFGEEWTKFDYSSIDTLKLKENFDQYFNIFPWDVLPKDAVGFDMGCGTGRWAQFVAPKVKTLNCVEPSDAIYAAKKNLIANKNVTFFKETTENCSLSPGSQDFGYCLGVLHHIPNTQYALNDCTKLLKSGAPILLYLYYSFENKPLWFKALWKLSDYIRKVISICPKPIKHFLVSLIAIFVYFPLTHLAFILEKIGFNVENIPLADYRKKPFYQCKNDALDRFGTRLEQRFSKSQITEMLTNAGCKGVKFSPNTPFWCCVAFKK
jgi:SAM-dependent methyltransferase